MRGIGRTFIAIILALVLSAGVAGAYPVDLWKGLMAEDTSGNLNTYRIIASICRNRLKNGLSVGLMALKRKGLDGFIKRNRAYVLAKKGVDLKVLATQAINEVFVQGKDYAYGATHYEHTRIYPTPKWVKGMKVIKVVYPNTKQELTLWR